MLPGQLTSAFVQVTVTFCYGCCVTGLLYFLDPHIDDNIQRSSSSVWLSSLSAAPSGLPSSRSRNTAPALRTMTLETQHARPLLPLSLHPSLLHPLEPEGSSFGGCKASPSLLYTASLLWPPSLNSKKQKHPLPHSSWVYSLFFALSVITLYPSI